MSCETAVEDELAAFFVEDVLGLSSDEEELKMPTSVRAASQGTTLKVAAAAAADCSDCDSSPAPLSHNAVPHVDCNGEEGRKPHPPWAKYMSNPDDAEYEVDLEESDGAADTDEGTLVSQLATVDGVERDVLLHGSWLRHQRYHDEMKFANHRFIQFELQGRALVLEQNWRLGKGGMFWDASFMAAEHLARHPPRCLPPSYWRVGADSRRPHILELGCGPGLLGISLATRSGADVTLTDVGSIVPLATANAARHQEVKLEDFFVWNICTTLLSPEGCHLDSDHHATRRL